MKNNNTYKKEIDNFLNIYNNGGKYITNDIWKNQQYCQKWYRWLWYSEKLQTKDISKIIKKITKIIYPKVKLSVTADRIDSISIYLLYTPENIILPEKIYLKKTSRRLYKDNEIFNDKGLQLYTLLKNICEHFNYDYSESLTDYFATKFYYDIEIGKWDKKYTYWDIK